jgi:hypothetical protein
MPSTRITNCRNITGPSRLGSRELVMSQDVDNVIWAPESDPKFFAAERVHLGSEQAS